MIAGDPLLSRSAHFTSLGILRALLIGALFALALALVFAFQAAPEPLRLEPGKPSPKTILAHERVTFISEILTEDARAKAEAQVKDVYDLPDASLARKQVRDANRILDYFDSVRHDPYSSLERKLEWVQQIPTLTLPTLMLSRTLALEEPVYHRIVTETVYVLDVTMRNAIRPSDLSAEFTKVPARISLAFSAEQTELVTAWVQAFIAPNSFFNPIRTNEDRARARARVGAVYQTIEKGQALVREGEVVTPLALEALAGTGFLRPSLSAADYAGSALLAILLAVLLAIFLIHLRPLLITQPRTLLLIAFLILIFAAGAKTLGDRPTLLHYLYPISAAAMLLTVLVDSSIALGATMILAVTFGFFVHGSLELTLYALAGGIVASLSLGRIERLPAFLWSGAYVAATNAAVVAVFRALALEKDFTVWGTTLGAALGNGALSGLIALGSLFVIGKLFGITTSLELLDLARPTHLLLKKLLVEAPGTYHHSLIVSQLAEQAAQRIGADALLVRVAAYYHDVGKTRDPQSFVENQMDGINVHDTLAPKASAGIVIDHVARGIALAKKFGIPERLRDFIPQHHGTTLAAYFHRKAIKENGNAAPIEEKDYRYPGPKPQSRETAILMLADGVEATTRAERPTTPEQIRAIVDRIFNERLRDGQLDESDLTLRDLQQTKEAFFGVLQGLYHPRVKYPEPPRAVDGETVR
ncbi:MAG: HDIG domain-containing protein [Anaerolineales bacterium]|nr:HDIG domain-containing protein [Anaerolineales bacterium]